MKYLQAFVLLLLVLPGCADVPKVLEGVAVFVLATTKPFRGISSLESRLVPLSETWTRAFNKDNVYYVMGANYFDYSYLKRRCKLRRMEGENVDKDMEILRDGETNEAAESPVRTKHGQRRQLIPKAKQRKSENRRLVWECGYDSFLPSKHVPDDTGSAPPRTMNVLFTANCTGEYFGFGPACRCQESMRFYIYHKQQQNLHSSALFKKTEWFIFIDDDLYIRPYALQAILNSLSYIGPNSKSHEQKKDWRNVGADVYAIRSSDQPMALVQAEMTRSFDFSKRWQGISNCRVGGVHNLYLAMPAIMNSATINLFQSAIDADAMTTAQLKWGGTHDMLLGMLLWIYKVNLFSINYTYFAGRIFAEKSHIYYFQPSRHIFIHGVKNMDIAKKKSKEIDEGEESKSNKQTIPSQYDIAISFQDCTYPGNEGYNICDIYGNEFSSSGVLLQQDIRQQNQYYKNNAKYTDLATMIRNQAESGIRGVEALVKLPPSMVNVTVFAEKALRLKFNFTHFDFTDCELTKEASREVKLLDTKIETYTPALENIPSLYLDAVGLSNKLNKLTD